MKRFAPILGVVTLLGIVPLATSSNVVLNFLVLVLLIALAGQGWNLLGGYGGQYSFGHAAFFGTGAYVTAVLQARYGVNAWAGFGLGIAAGALTGAIIGGLSFRSGLKGSYFALVTLAFAEVLRIIASAAPITGAGVGTLIPLDLRPAAFQFQSRAPFYWIVLGLVGVSLAIVRAIEDSRFGAYLIAVRENEDAARALGVNTTAVKIIAMTISAAITAAAGGFYAQYFLFVDAGIAYGPWISVEALLAPIIGGAGTVFGPLLGALVVKTLGELGKMAAGDAPGLDLVIYGCVLILVVAVAPRGIAGFLEALSWPGNSALKTRVNALMSRPPRLSGRSASIIEVAGTSPATTPEGDSNRPETSVGRGPTALERSDG
jgi:branched-chain amino acid transport system permease protein